MKSFMIPLWWLYCGGLKQKQKKNNQTIKV